MDFDALWERIDGPTLAGDWTEGSVLDPGPEVVSAPPLPRIDLEEDFDIRSVLGRGGNGVVMEAYQRSLNRTVAIKVLSDVAGARVATALLAEARSAGQLEHPNIVPIHALGQDADGRPIMIMKRLSGVSWARLLREPEHPIWEALPPDPLDRQLHIAMQVVAAVNHAHQAGVVHRDIKPGNVMIGPGGEVCLVDWGLAQRVGEDARGPAGTPGFMPPEMLERSVIVDPRTDVYLLGATLYSALTGEVPHSGDDLASIVRSTVSGAVRIPGHLPAELGRVLERAMAGDANARFPTVIALRDALLAFDAHREADRLCDEAETHLAQIHADNPERATAFGAATFGYGAALDRWAESPRAAVGLRAARVRMADALLEVGHLESAQRQIEQLDAPPDRLLARLDGLLEAQAKEAAEVARLRDAVDPVAGYEGRRVMFPILLVIAVIGPLVMGSLRIAGRLDVVGFPFRRAFAPMALGALILGALAIGRRPGLRQAFNRRVLGVLGILILTVGFSFLSGGLLGLTVPQIVARNLLLNAFSATIVAWVVSRDFVWAALVSWTAAFVAATWTPVGELLLGVSNCVTVLVLWLLWRRRSVRATADGDGSER